MDDATKIEHLEEQVDLMKGEVRHLRDFQRSANIIIDAFNLFFPKYEQLLVRVKGLEKTDG